MSYGTILFPKIEDFSNLCNLSIEELQSSIDSEVRLMSNKFNEIRALAFCTPHDVFGDSAYDKIKSLVDQYLNDYIESYSSCFDLRNVLDLKEQSQRIKDGDTYEDGSPKRAYLYFNRFVYHSQYEAESLVKENTQELLKLKGRILGICLATPIDITPRDQTQYSDGHEEPILVLERELDYMEEALDECLRTIYVAKITAKYWDGHEEG
jgi:hypothetical protein